ncbi:MAG: transmembrane anchor protein [Egibacteraceae bacterium]
MYNADAPPRSELPSPRALVRSTLIAIAVALVLLFTAILPAEYGIDPTRIGRVLGLTQMGEIKMALAREAEAEEAGADAAAPSTPAAASTPDAAAPVAAAAPDPAASDVTELTLAPGQGREIKLAMREGARVSFEWTVDGGVVNYDTHADRPGTPYHGYEKGQARASQTGELVAAFDGMHGWFWRNRGREPVTVTLRTRGDYQELKEIE